ncbi:hypothetical protein STEG23_024994 [Scotinomys teguina]
MLDLLEPELQMAVSCLTQDFGVPKGECATDCVTIAYLKIDAWICCSPSPAVDEMLVFARVSKESAAAAASVPMLPIGGLSFGSSLLKLQRTVSVGKIQLSMTYDDKSALVFVL